MKLKVNKIALSLAAAALIVTSLLSTVTSASAANEITLTADKSAVKPGERINITVGFIPDETGAAGFTVNLHYDPDKIEVYIPSQSETDSEYKAESQFSVVTDYDYSEGTVRIVGANLTSENITSATSLAIAAFTVKSGASGDINFWTEVETMVSVSDSGYVNSPYSAPTEEAPLTVSCSDKADDDTATTTTKSASTTTTSKSTNDADSQTTTTTKTAASATTAKTTSETTTKEQSESLPNTTSGAIAKPEDTTAATMEKDEKTEPLYTYQTQDTAYNSEQPVSCSFSLSDYITDFSKPYNLKVTISTSGSVNGGIGMLIDGGWQSWGNITHRSGTDIWTADNIDPNLVSGDVFIQLYYLKENSEFSVDSIQAVVADYPDNSVSDDGNTEADDSNTEASQASEMDEDNSQDGQDVENTVLNAAEEAKQNPDSSPDESPTTGAKSRPIRIVIMIVCSAEIVWSLFVVIYNRVNRSKEK